MLEKVITQMLMSNFKEQKKPKHYQEETKQCMLCTLFQGGEPSSKCKFTANIMRWDAGEAIT